MIQIKRAYEKAAKEDGTRVLIDRLWPRGVSKAKLKLDGWEKGIAPSTALRTWFGHKPERWSEFKKRYKAELRSHKTELAALRKLGNGKTLTLVYGAKDEKHNDAVVLLEILRR